MELVASAYAGLGSARARTTYWLDDLLPADTLSPLVPVRWGARGEADTNMNNQEASENVGLERKRILDPGPYCGSDLLRISHSPRPSSPRRSLKEHQPAHNQNATHF